MIRTGVDGDPWGLVEDEDVPVLVYDVQGPGDRPEGVVRFGIPHQDGQDLPRPDPDGHKGRYAVQQDAVRDALGPFDRGAREMQRPPQEGIHRAPLLVPDNGEQEPAGGYIVLDGRI